MITLHLEVPVTDVAAWKRAFSEHAETRRDKGVRNVAVRRPVGGESRLDVDLDFDSVPEAEQFLRFLQESIWRDQPILAGEPKASILEAVDVS